MYTGAWPSCLGDLGGVHLIHALISPHSISTIRRTSWCGLQSWKSGAHLRVTFTPGRPLRCTTRLRADTSAADLLVSTTLKSESSPELNIWWLLSTLHSALYTPYSALHTQHSTLYTQHSTLHTQHSTLSTPHSALSTPHSALYTPHSALHTPYSALHTPHSALYTPYSALLVYFVCMHHYMRTKYLLRGTVGWRPSPLYMNKVIIITQHSTLSILYSELYTQYSALSTPHSAKEGAGVAQR